MHVLESIPVAFDADEVLRQMSLAPDSECADEIRACVARCQAVVRPRVAYGVAFVENRAGDAITLKGVTFRSRVLSRNLETVERVFPFVASCGPELDALPADPDDVMGPFCREILKETALFAATQALSEHIRTVYKLPKFTSMHPGSGDAQVWPIEQQRELFALLGDGPGKIGVHLTDTCLMLPNKTVSGILYPTEVNFVTCTLCHRETCPNRQAPFDSQAWEAQWQDRPEPREPAGIAGHAIEGHPRA